MNIKQKTKKSHLQLLLEAKLENVGMTCYPSEIRLRSMYVYVIKFEHAEHPVEVILPTHEVAYRVAIKEVPPSEEALRNYDVPIIDAVAYALAYYWSMPTSVQEMLKSFGEIGSLRAKAVEHLGRFYGLD